MRSLAAGAVGAGLMIAVVHGQPALAEQAAHVKHPAVTSAGIKNGTIKKKDLSAGLKASLARADTALQGVPDGSVTTSKLADSAVTGAKVSNGSLGLADVAIATGTVSLDFMNLAPAACQPLGVIATGHVVTGALTLVSNPSGVAGNISLVARADAGLDTAINIVACNIGNSAFDPPPTSYTWAVIGS